jgi:hypothetical protein
MGSTTGVSFSLNICDNYFGGGGVVKPTSSSSPPSSPLLCPHCKSTEVQPAPLTGKIPSCDQCAADHSPDRLGLSADLERVSIAEEPSAPKKSSKRSRAPSHHDAMVKEHIRSMFSRNPISSSLSAISSSLNAMDGRMLIHSPLKKMAVNSAQNDNSGPVIEDYFSTRGGGTKPVPRAAPVAASQPAAADLSPMEARLANLRAKAAKWDQHTSVPVSQTVRHDKFSGDSNMSTTDTNEYVNPTPPRVALSFDIDKLGPYFSLAPGEVCDLVLAYLPLAPDLLKLCRVCHSFRSMALHPSHWTNVDFHKCVSRTFRVIPKVTDSLVASIALHAPKMKTFAFEGPKTNPFASTSLPAMPYRGQQNQDDEGRSMDALNTSMNPHLPRSAPSLLSGTCLQALAFSCASLTTVRLILPGWGQQPAGPSRVDAQQLHRTCPSLEAKSVAILLRQCTWLEKLLVGPGIKDLAEAMDEERVPARLPCLKELSLFQCHELVDLDVIALANRCHNLESFRAHPSPLLTNASLSSIAKHCGRSLKSVVVGSDLSNGVGQHSEISDPAALLARCPSLRQLRLSYCRVNLTSVLQKISVYSARHNCCLDKLHLQFLNLRVATASVEEGSDPEDLSSDSQSQDLDHAVVAGRSLYSTAPPKMLGNIANTYYSSGAVRSLDLENCAVEDLTLKQICSALPGLEKLHVRSFKAFASTFPELTAVGITAISTLRSLVSLELQVPTLSVTAASAAEDVGGASSSRVGEGMSPLVLASFDKLFQSCSLIRTLHFGFTGFTDAGVACVSRHCHMLETLKLTGCSVTENMFPALANGVCQNLKGIVLVSCRRVNNIGDALPVVDSRSAPFPLLKLVVLKDSGFVSRLDSVRISCANCGFVVLHGRGMSAMKVHDGTWEVDTADQIRKWKPSVNVLAA